MKPLRRWALVVFTAGFLWPQLGAAQRNLAVAPARATEARVALVIGNSAYKGAPLRNPVNDATDIAATLRSLGFSVTLRTNADTRQMRAAIRQFAQSLKRGGVGLFYFAGHGVQSRSGRNYLIPVNADLKEEFELEDEAVDASRVLAGMEAAGNRVNIVILDACRNKPFASSWRSAVNGLAQMNAPMGSFVGFATAPGSIAADGAGRNGIYTKYLLENLKAGDPHIDRVFTRVTAAVARETANKQVPWKSSSLTGDFYFRVPSGNSQAMADGSPAALELEMWDSVKESKNPDELKAYLDQYPQGRFAGVAHARLKALGSPFQVAAAASSVQSLAPAAPANDLQRMTAGTVFRDCPNCPEMIVVPPGSFLMGESSKHSITLPRAYAVGKFEVTFLQWDSCVAAGGCAHKPSDYGWGRGTRPVINVSWDDAKQFTAWLTRKAGKPYRLLTEAEWEYAARAGTTTAYYWGDSDSDICRYASVDKGGIGCGSNKTSPVGERRPNAFGLYDMLGNVWEWTEDCWSESVEGVDSGASARTSGDCGQRVKRGGSWIRFTDYARATDRLRNAVDGRFFDLGFRVTRTQ